MTQDPSSIGRYRVQSLLGRGGMGAVYLVEDPKLKRLLVIKIVHEGGRHYAHAMERFQREAEISARLNHPNIITVHDVGEDPEWGPYIAMEYVQGTSLARLIHDQTSAPEALLHVLTQASRGLMAAAIGGIVHRDVKPENILVGQDGRVKLTDFGVARTSDSQHLTTIGGIIGTPSYFAPELLQDAEASPSTDCYALAVTAFESLTGLLPFQGDSVASTLLRIVNEPPSIPPGMEPAMRMVFMKAFSKKPKDRFPDAYGFMGALVDAAPVGENIKSKLHSAMEGTEVSLTGLEPGRSPMFTPSRPTGRPTAAQLAQPSAALETPAPPTASAPVAAAPVFQPQPALTRPVPPEPMGTPPRQGNSQILGLVFAGIGALVVTGAGVFGWRWWRVRAATKPSSAATASPSPAAAGGEAPSPAPQPSPAPSGGPASPPMEPGAAKPSLSQLQQQLKDLQERNAQEAEKLRLAKGGSQPGTSSIQEPPRPAQLAPSPAQPESEPQPQPHAQAPESQPIVHPRLISQAPATFPRRARDLRFEMGKDHIVRLRVTVDEQGHPVAVALLEGVNGIYGFNEEAISAAKRSRFAPGTRGGRPVREPLDVEYLFKAGR